MASKKKNQPGRPRRLLLSGERFERLRVDLLSDEKVLVRRAAAVSDSSIAAFVRRVIVETAKKVLFDDHS